MEHNPVSVISLINKLQSCLLVVFIFPHQRKLRRSLVSIRSLSLRMGITCLSVCLCALLCSAASGDFVPALSRLVSHVKKVISQFAFAGQGSSEIFIFSSCLFQQNPLYTQDNYFQCVVTHNTNIKLRGKAKLWVFPKLFDQSRCPETAWKTVCDQLVRAS